MMEVSKEINRIKKIVVPILKKNGVVRAGIFGSYARGEIKKNSDIDFLVELKGRKSLLDVVGLQLDIQEKLRNLLMLLNMRKFTHV
jgi:hypothetical protein